MVAHLHERDARPGGDLGVETLTVFLQVLEDWGVVHLEYLTEKLKQQLEPMTKRMCEHVSTDYELRDYTYNPRPFCLPSLCLNYEPTVHQVLFWKIR